MDTSKEYIKMCEKAKEVQKEWKTPGDNDCYIYTDEPIKVWFFPSDLRGRVSIGEWKLIWIPRQDQLQEMVIGESNDFIGLLSKAFCWTKEYKTINNIAVYYTSKFNSMEQLWLAFVMEEKYNKIWNGKKWEKKK